MKRTARKANSGSKREAGVLHTQSQYEVEAGQDDATKRSPAVDVIDISRMKETVRKKAR